MINEILFNHLIHQVSRVPLKTKVNLNCEDNDNHFLQLYKDYKLLNKNQSKSYLNYHCIVDNLIDPIYKSCIPTKNYILLRSNIIMCILIEFERLDKIICNM